MASVEGGAMSSPLWLMRTLTDPSDSFDVRKKAAENGYLAFADRGRPLRADDDGVGPSGPRLALGAGLGLGLGSGSGSGSGSGVG